ncbi:MAG: tetratricopeptide repeat protein [Pseudomonadota bacterium]
MSGVLLLETGGGLEVLTRFADDDAQTSGRHLEPGTPIGPYEVGERVGHGGMGSVYRAVRRHDGFEQEVALKIIRSGSVPRDELLARFRHEQRILASLNALGVSRMLDSGVSENGHPYLVMEYIEGMPLQEYCEQRELSTRDRLEQLIRLCRIIAHCHRRGVIHGDIKSNNVLIDTDGEVRLLDFGIAEMLGDREHPESDEPRSVAMTLAVASPEQALGEPVTTESDVYQLGLMIYSLLSGTTPHRVQPESEPDTWATQITTLPLPSVDEHVRWLKRDRVSDFGDLNDIARTATAKNPESRYRSADLLADDLLSYLDHRPISTRQHDRWYRLGKLMRRNRLASALALLLSVALPTALAAYIQQLNASRAAAETAALKASRTLDFISSLFEISAPENRLGEPVTAKQLLDQGVQKLEPLRQSDPRSFAELRLELVGRYLRLAEYGSALDLAVDTLAVIRSDERYGDLLVFALDQQATALSGLERHAEALTLAQQAWDLFTVAPENHPRVKAYLLHYSLANASFFLGRLEQAEEESLAALGSLDSEEAMEAQGNVKIRIHQMLGNVSRKMGNPQGALEQFQLAHDRVVEEYGSNHPEFVRSLGNLSLANWGLGNYGKALALSESVYDANRRVYGARNKHTSTALGNLALNYVEVGRYDEAIEKLSEQQGIVSELGLGARSVGNNWHNTGFALQSAGRYREAQQSYEQALDAIVEASGEDSLWAANMLGNLGEVAVELGEFQQAEAYFERSLNIKQKRLDDTSSGMAWPYYGMGLLDLRRGRLDSATAHLGEALDRLIATLGQDHPETAFPLTALGMLAIEAGDYAEAQRHLEKALALRSHLPSQAGPRQQTVSALAEALAAQGKEDELARLRAQVE